MSAPREWFAVRVVLAHPALPDGRVPHEERITLWSAADREQATGLAWADAQSDGSAAIVLEGVTVSQLPEPPTHGSVVFSTRQVEQHGGRRHHAGQEPTTVQMGTGTATADPVPAVMKAGGAQGEAGAHVGGRRDRSSAPGGRSGRPRDAELTARVVATAGDLMADQGLGGLTLDGLARGSGAGKSAISRRWPNLLELAAAVATGMHLVAKPVNLGSLRADLRAFTTQWAQPLTPQELAAGSLLSAAAHHRELSEPLERALHRPAAAAVALIGQRAQARGHSSGPWLHDVAVRVVTAQVVSRLAAGPVSVDGAERLAEDVLMPLFPNRPTRVQNSPQPASS